MKIKHINSMRIALILISCFIIIDGIAISADNVDVVIIANKTIKMDRLSAKEIKNIYLGFQKKWPNGENIVITTVEKGDLPKKFLKTYISKTPVQFKNYWDKKLFTGKEFRVKSFKEEKSLAKYVANTMGAIGYVSKKKVSDEVKILLVD